MFTIDHLGIAVKSLAAAKSIYEKLGLTASAEEVVEGEQVRVGDWNLRVVEMDKRRVAQVVATQVGHPAEVSAPPGTSASSD